MIITDYMTNAWRNAWSTQQILIYCLFKWETCTVWDWPLDDTVSQNLCQSERGKGDVRILPRARIQRKHAIEQHCRVCLYHPAKWSPCLLKLPLSTHQIFITAALQATRIKAKFFHHLTNCSHTKPTSPLTAEVIIWALLSNYSVGG